MVRLHPDLRPLTCMLIDIGRFQWTWLPMGMIVASDVFQMKLDEIFHNVPGVTGIADDMVIYGKSIEEHEKYFLNFLSIVRKNNLKLNASKLQFQLKEVSFFGHYWSSQGISPDPKKIHAIQQMVFPPDKESMQSFLGMVNFLNRYSPQLAELSASLRQLCRSHVDYKPESGHYKSFNTIKKELSTKLCYHTMTLLHIPHFKLIVPKRSQSCIHTKWNSYLFFQQSHLPYRIQLSEP